MNIAHHFNAALLCCVIAVAGATAHPAHSKDSKTDIGSNEGYFFHRQGAPSPLSEPASTLVGTHAAVLELCSSKQIANNFQVEVRKYLQLTKTPDGKATLSKRIRATFLKSKKTLISKTRKEVCLAPKQLTERTQTIIQLMKYDWGFQQLPRGKSTAIRLGNKKIMIGASSKKQKS